MAPSELAALLAGRLCHDFISPASAIMSGVDLLEDPTATDMREDAMKLIEASARKMVAQLAFARVAFGGSSAAESFDARELERLTAGVFEHVRAALDWTVRLEALDKPCARTILNLAQIGGGGLPTGGTASVSADIKDGAVEMTVSVAGPRVRFRAEVMRGLAGEPLGEGLSGHWVQAYFVHAIVTAAGGALRHEVAEDRAVLTARIPLEPPAPA
jgi:histidine phosphotransferase ChpT